MPTVRFLGESMNPMLLLDPDQMSRLESVLQSDEARNFLGEVKMRNKTLLSV
jgi:hypothetical protein